MEWNNLIPSFLSVLVGLFIWIIFWFTFRWGLKEENQFNETSFSFKKYWWHYLIGGVSLIILQFIPGFSFNLLNHIFDYLTSTILSVQEGVGIFLIIFLSLWIIILINSFLSYLLKSKVLLFITYLMFLDTFFLLYSWYQNHFIPLFEIDFVWKYWGIWNTLISFIFWWYIIVFLFWTFKLIEKYKWNFLLCVSFCLFFVAGYSYLNLIWDKIELFWVNWIILILVFLLFTVKPIEYYLNFNKNQNNDQENIFSKKYLLIPFIIFIIFVWKSYLIFVHKSIPIYSLLNDNCIIYNQAWVLPHLKDFYWLIIFVPVLVYLYLFFSLKNIKTKNDKVEINEGLDFNDLSNRKKIVKYFIIGMLLLSFIILAILNFVDLKIFIF